MGDDPRRVPRDHAARVVSVASRTDRWALLLGRELCRLAAGDREHLALDQLLLERWLVRHPFQEEAEQCLLELSRGDDEQ